ncbi:MAG TPA: sulfotransferase, partial [Acidisoma sp.]|uniref:sulfotransferase family protein n=1 Tax=Acidisoma sp. TaxID=1872115 RepID=UPI002D03984B
MTVATSALYLADLMSRMTGLGRRPFNAESLLKEALAGSPATTLGPDFGPSQFMEGLVILLSALESEANLSLFGRLAVRYDTIRCMRNLIRMSREETREPSIVATPIRRPLIVTGLPRSGTTFLHRLLDCDPRTRSPSVWQTMAPYPPEHGPDRRIEKTERDLRAFARFAPGFRDVHPLTARMPQECTEITAQVFQSLRFDTTYRIPTYLTWQDAQGHNLAYRFHKRFLQHLQHQSGDDPDAVQWVLKCPDHVFALDAIRMVYPDARIVFVHRDPLKVLPSVARLTEILRQPFTSEQDKPEIGAQVTGRWHQGVEAMMAAADTNGGAVGIGGNICHIHYRDLTADPLGAING